MAAGLQAGLLEHIPNLHPNQRRIRGSAEIGARGEQADKTALTDHLALIIEAQDTDVIHVPHPVHRAARPGLGDDQRVVAIGPGRLAQRRQRPTANRLFILAQNTQPRALDQAQAFLFAFFKHLVVARAQEKKMVITHPVEEIPGLLHHVPVDTHRPIRQTLDGLFHPRKDLLPVGHSHRDIVHGTGQCRLDPGQHLGIILAVDLHVNDGFEFAFIGSTRVIPQNLTRLIPIHVDQGMDHQVHIQVELRHHHIGGIDQERPIVIDQLNDRVLALPPVFFQVGVEYINLAFTRQAFADELHLAGNHRGQHLCRRVTQVFGRHPAKKGIDVVSGLLGLDVGPLAGDQRFHLVQQLLSG